MIEKVRFLSRSLLPVLLLAIVAAGCGDNGVEPEDEDPLAAFVGTWNASSFVYTSADNPELSIPVLQVIPGSSVSVTVQANGNFVASLNLGPQTDGETVAIGGSITHEGDDQITVTWEENPYFEAPLAVTYNFETQNTLTWEAPTTFDFNQDGTATAATLNVVFLRS